MNLDRLPPNKHDLALPIERNKFLPNGNPSPLLPTRGNLPLPLLDDLQLDQPTFRIHHEPASVEQPDMLE